MSQTAIQLFRSGVTKKLLLLVLYTLPFVSFFVLYGILNFRFLQAFAYIPIGIGALLATVLAMVNLSCLNRSITIDAITIKYKAGSSETTVIRRNIRDMHLRRNFLYSQLVVGDGECSFTIMDISFPQFNKISEIAKADKTARAVQSTDHLI